MGNVLEGRLLGLALLVPIPSRFAKSQALVILCLMGLGLLGAWVADCSKHTHCFQVGVGERGNQRHLSTTHIHFCSQLCLEFVVKVLDVELVCEALQVGVAGPWQVVPGVQSCATWPLQSPI